MDTLFNELGDVLFYGKLTAMFRQPLAGVHGTTTVSLIHVSSRHAHLQQ